MCRGQAWRLIRQQQQPGRKAAQGWADRSGEMMGRARRGRVVRVLAASGPAEVGVVASEAGKAALRGHQRVCYLFGAGRVNPVSIKPPRRFP